MENLNFLVIPVPGDPFAYYLDCVEKDFRLYVMKTFEDAREASYNYEFLHLDEENNMLFKDELKAFIERKGITRADNMRAAIWFLSSYFSFRELNYEFPLDKSFKVGSYYQIAGREHLKKWVFQLNKQQSL